MKAFVLYALSTPLYVLVHAERHHGRFKRQDTATDTQIPPLASITMGMPTRPPPAFTATYTPGATPPLSGAPVLPTALALSGWPQPDQVPDTNSPEVQAWMKELDGVSIPNISPTKESSCSADPAAAAEAEQRGWWTCGGYTRSTDIAACPERLHWGLSFDDGPSPYTPDLIAKLKEKNLRATFFVVGSRVIQRPEILIEEYMNGHEISVHTWSHTPLTTLTNEQIVAELGWTRKAIKDVLGITPTTMRPPTGDIDDRVRAISLAMGMVPVLWSSTPDGGKFDSNDWKVASGELTGPQSFTIFEDLMRNATTFNTGFITLQHDLFEITVDLAVGYTLDAALSHDPKFVLQPVGECMGWPPGTVYAETKQKTAARNATTSEPRTPDDNKSDQVDAKQLATSGAVSIIAPIWCLVSTAWLVMVGIF